MWYTKENFTIFHSYDKLGMTWKAVFFFFSLFFVCLFLQPLHFPPQFYIQNQLPKIWQITDLKSLLHRGLWSFDRFFCSGNHFNKQFQYTFPSELFWDRNERKITFHLPILNGMIFFPHFQSVTEFSARPIHREFQPPIASTWENKEWVKPEFQWDFQVLHHIDGTPSSYIFNCFLSTNNPRPQKNAVSPQTPVKAGKCQWKQSSSKYLPSLIKRKKKTPKCILVLQMLSLYASYQNDIIFIEYSILQQCKTLFWIIFCYYLQYCTRNWVQLLIQTGFTVMYTDPKLNWILHSLLLLIQS